MENPIKMDDLGVPLFSETSISGLYPIYPIDIQGSPLVRYLRSPQKCLRKNTKSQGSVALDVVQLLEQNNAWCELEIQENFARYRVF